MCARRSLERRDETIKVRIPRSETRFKYNSSGEHDLDFTIPYDEDSMTAIPISDFERRLPALVDLLQQVVEIESPTTVKEAVDEAGVLIADRMRHLGAEVHRFPQPDAGDHWLGNWDDGPGGVLMLTHVDTVHPKGTLAHMPWRKVDGRLHGPGVLDMKASLAMALTAIRAIQEVGRLGHRRLSLLCTSDEETGSHTSAALIRSLAAEYDLVLCLEPALPDGALKTWRKGIGMFEVTATGKASHAGASPSEGINAVIEMAHQILRLTSLADEAAGTTINVGVIHGGTRSNVVPSSCWAKVDVRVLEDEEQARISSALGAMKPHLPGAEVTVRGEWNRPPMPRTPLMAKTFGKALRIASQLGLTLTEGGTGGGSDANFVAPLGVPLLDGLGAIGGGAHSEREHVHLGTLAGRTALIAALLTEW